MQDMSVVIKPRSDQLNSDDFITGPRTITITGVKITEGAEQPCSIFFEGDEGKPWKICKTMARVLAYLWGPDATQYTGRSVTLYRDPKVTWAGMAVGGIRISHMSHIASTATLALMVTRGNKKPFVVQPLVMPAQDEHRTTIKPEPQGEEVNELSLLMEAERAADQGGAALDAHWKTLSGAQRAALKPHGADLRARANAASGGHGAQTDGQSDAVSRETPFELFDAPGIVRKFAEVADYLKTYEITVTFLYSNGKSRELLEFDNLNRASINALGLADKVKVINERVRVPAEQRGFEV